MAFKLAKRLSVVGSAPKQLLPLLVGKGCEGAPDGVTRENKLLRLLQLLALLMLMRFL